MPTARSKEVVVAELRKRLKMKSPTSTKLITKLLDELDAQNAVNEMDTAVDGYTGLGLLVCYHHKDHNFQNIMKMFVLRYHVKWEAIETYTAEFSMFGWRKTTTIKAYLLANHKGVHDELERALLAQQAQQAADEQAKQQAQQEQDACVAKQKKINERWQVIFESEQALKNRLKEEGANVFDLPSDKLDAIAHKAIDAAKLYIIPKLVKYKPRALNSVNASGFSVIDRLVILGNKDASRIVLQASASIGLKSSALEVAAHRALDYGQFTILKKILDQLNKNPKAVNAEGQTVLTRLISNGHNDLAQILIDYELDSVVGTLEEKSIMMHEAMDDENYPLVEYIANKQPKLFAYKNAEGKTILMRIVEIGHEHLCQAVLQNSGTTGPEGNELERAAHLALDHDHLKILAKILERLNKNPKAVNAEGQTVLTRLTRGGHHGLVQVLIDHELDSVVSTLEEKSIMVHEAIDYEQFPLVAYIASKQPDLLACRSVEGKTVLMRLIEHRKQQLALSLLDTYDPSVVGLDEHQLISSANGEDMGKTALHFTIVHNTENVFDKILEIYAETSSPEATIRKRSVTDENGNTPFHFAVIYQQPSMAKKLFAAGVDIGKKNHNNTAVIHLLVMASRDLFLDLLKALVKKHPEQIEVSGPKGYTPMHIIIDPPVGEPSVSIAGGDPLATMNKPPHIMEVLIANTEQFSADSTCSRGLTPLALAMRALLDLKQSARVHQTIEEYYEYEMTIEASVSRKKEQAYVAIVKLLLNAGADPSAGTITSEKPIVLALQLFNKAIFELMLGAKPSLIEEKYYYDERWMTVNEILLATKAQWQCNSTDPLFLSELNNITQAIGAGINRSMVIHSFLEGEETLRELIKKTAPASGAMKILNDTWSAVTNVWPTIQKQGITLNMVWTGVTGVSASVGSTVLYCYRERVRAWVVQTRLYTRIYNSPTAWRALPPLGVAAVLLGVLGGYQAFNYIYSPEQLPGHFYANPSSRAEPHPLILMPIYFLLRSTEIACSLADAVLTALTTDNFFKEIQEPWSFAQQWWDASHDDEDCSWVEVVSEPSALLSAPIDLVTCPKNIEVDDHGSCEQAYFSVPDYHFMEHLNGNIALAACVVQWMGRAILKVFGAHAATTTSRRVASVKQSIGSAPCCRVFNRSVMPALVFPVISQQQAGMEAPLLLV